MLRFFRKIRQNLLENGKLRTYFWYAVGEILLVVIGILIALQINNWNENRIDEEILWGYLKNIKSNIETDLIEAQNLNFLLDQLSVSTPEILALKSKSSISYLEHEVLINHLINLQSIGDFKASTAGFDALKSTGSIGLLQGTHMEELLFKYYDHLTQLETEFSRRANLRDDLIAEYNKTDWGFRQSDLYMLLSDTSKFAEINQDFLLMMNSPVVESAIGTGYFNYFTSDYEMMKELGSLVVEMIDKETLFIANDDLKKVDMFNSDFSNEGVADVVVNGSLPTWVVVVNVSNINGDGVDVSKESDHLNINFQNHIDWGAALFIVDSLGVNTERPFKNYNGFRSIHLDLKSTIEGSQISFAVKDKYDPDDGSESRVNIELTTEWKTHIIDLSDLETADISKINVLAAFIVDNQEITDVQIKNIRYIKE